MLCFSALSPFPYISKGLLMDLTPLFAEDPELALDDLVIANALTAQGSMYVASGEFFFETLVGLPSRFENQYGWTLQDYLQIESAVSDDIQTIYNMTKEGFLKEIAARYIRTAVVGRRTLLFRLRRLYRNSASKCPNSRKPRKRQRHQLCLRPIRSWKRKMGRCAKLGKYSLEVGL